MPPLRGNNSGMFDAIYGDGADGVVTFTSDTTLLRDMNYEILTINKGVRIFANGYKIRCRQQCYILGDEFDVGTILNNGLNARNSNGTVAEVSSSVPAGTSGGPAGSTGGGGVGGAGMYNGGYPIGSSLHDAGGGAGQLVPAVAQSTNPFYFLGGAGGAGGNAQAVLSGSTLLYVGATGSSGSVQVNAGGLHDFFAAMTCGNMGLPSGATGSYTPFAGGGGGGAGACGNSGSIGVRPRSGWGGGGGGVVYIAARDLIFLGKVQAKGGAGGNSFSRGAGGGGGGGGFVMLVYSSILLRNSLNDQIDVSGGAPGLGFTASGVVAPTSGSNGSFFTYGI
ncbi:MAG: hypothetical protein JO270_18300 [Acidobacteriaceae bacterium]|nr:hypothetical protein [Acidobacteriaceae bacterium]